MTVERHITGKHYQEISGSRWAVLVYLVTGLVVGKLRIRPTYKGVKRR